MGNEECVGEKTKTLIKVGPFLGPSSIKAKNVEYYMDEKGHDNINRIFISYGDNYISALQFQYVEDGINLLSHVYGRHDASNFLRITLEDGEYITHVSGFGGGIEGDYQGGFAIKSLTIGTNQRRHGPFGSFESKDQQKFRFDFGPTNQFGGFHGTFIEKKNVYDSSYFKPMLHSIGVYVKP